MNRIIVQLQAGNPYKSGSAVYLDINGNRRSQLAFNIEDFARTRAHLLRMQRNSHILHQSYTGAIEQLTGKVPMVTAGPENLPFRSLLPIPKNGRLPQI